MHAQAPATQKNQAASYAGGASSHTPSLATRLFSSYTLLAISLAILTIHCWSSTTSDGDVWCSTVLAGRNGGRLDVNSGRLPFCALARRSGVVLGRGVDMGDTSMSSGTTAGRNTAGGVARRNRSASMRGLTVRESGERGWWTMSELSSSGWRRGSDSGA